MAQSSRPFMTRSGTYASSDHWGSSEKALSRHAALKAFTGPTVYAARIGSVVKIGHTRNLANRVRSLSNYNGEPVELIAFKFGSLDDEAAIHSSLVEHRARGDEYYHPTEPVMRVVNEMRDAFNLPHLAA